MSNVTYNVSDEQLYFRGDKVYYFNSVEGDPVKFEALVVCSQKDEGLSNDHKSFRLLKVNSRNEVLPSGELIQWIHESKLSLLDRADEEKIKIIEDYETRNFI